MTSAVLSLVSGVGVALLAHLLALCRDRDTRRRAFAAFLNQWRAEIARPVSAPAGYYSEDPSVAAFQARVPSFHAEVQRVRGDFSDSQEFEALTSRLKNLKREDWQDSQPRDVILETMDRLIKLAA